MPYALVEALWATTGHETTPYGLSWPHWHLTPNLQRMLHIVKGSGELIIGLEAIEERLHRQWPQKTAAQVGCLQYLLLVSHDGSERFAVQLRAMWAVWGHLGRGVHLDATGQDVGRALFKKDKDIRLLMILGPPALVKVLLGLASSS